MFIRSATDKVFGEDARSEIAEQDHAIQEEVLETAHDTSPTLLPTIFSLAAGKSTTIEKESLEDVVALCRAQKNNQWLEDQYAAIAYAVKLKRHDVVKFLIDEGESAAATGPDVPLSGRAAVHHGYSPLELAINQQDVEMVKILLTYHSENRAIPEIAYRRVEGLFYVQGYQEYHYTGYPGGDGRDSSPLLDALATGNREIIDLVIKAYTDPKRLYTDFKTVQDAKNPSAMRSWIEQYGMLWKGEKPQVSDAVVKIFMNKNGLAGSFSDVATLLQFGWIVTRQEFEQVLVANDSQIVQLVLGHSRIEEHPFLLLAAYNRADLLLQLIEKGELPLPEHLDIAIKHGSLESVRALVEHGVSTEGALALAVDNWQFGIARYLASLSKNIYELAAFCRNQSDKRLRDRYPPIAMAVELGRHDLVKFFIEHGESVNAATPDVPVHWLNRAKYFSQVGSLQGYSPLEIAIKLQDVEMVRILVENGAVPEISHRRFSTVWAYGGSDFRTFDETGGVGSTGFLDGRTLDANGNSHYFDPRTNLPDRRTFDANGNLRYYEEPSTLLLDALNRGSQEIIDLVIKAHTSPEKLYEEYASVQNSKNPAAMRSWIEQNVFLWKGERVGVSDTAVKLFMENRERLLVSQYDIAILLQHGWMVTRAEFEEALTANNPQIERLLVDHSRLQMSPFDLLVQYNRASLVTYMIKEKGTLATKEHLDSAIKYSSLDVVKALLATGMAYGGALLLATQLKQKAIVECLLELPIDAKEIEEASILAYDLHAYEIMELLESR